MNTDSVIGALQEEVNEKRFYDLKKFAQVIAHRNPRDYYYLLECTSDHDDLGGAFPVPLTDKEVDHIQELIAADKEDLPFWELLEKEPVWKKICDCTEDYIADGFYDLQKRRRYSFKFVIQEDENSKQTQTIPFAAYLTDEEYEALLMWRLQGKNFAQLKEVCPELAHWIEGPVLFEYMIKESTKYTVQLQEIDEDMNKFINHGIAIRDYIRPKYKEVFPDKLLPILGGFIKSLEEDIDDYYWDNERDDFRAAWCDDFSLDESLTDQIPDDVESNGKSDEENCEQYGDNEYFTFLLEKWLHEHVTEGSCIAYKLLSLIEVPMIRKADSVIIDTDSVGDCLILTIDYHIFGQEGLPLHPDVPIYDMSVREGTLCNWPKEIQDQYE